MPASTLAAPDGRVVDYLRISITDRCNERCLYCMPEGYKGWQAREDTLTDDEVVRVARIAAGLGFRKYRITGGEPLVRKSVVDIIGKIWELPGVEMIGLSTNGEMAGSLNNIVYNDLGLDYWSRYPGLVDRVPLADVTAAGRRLFKVDSAVTLTVGPSERP